MYTPIGETAPQERQTLVPAWIVCTWLKHQCTKNWCLGTVYLGIDYESQARSRLYNLLHAAPHLPRHKAEDSKDDQAGKDATAKFV